jgi:hypothetical protein
MQSSWIFQREDQATWAARSCVNPQAFRAAVMHTVALTAVLCLTLGFQDAALAAKVTEQTEKPVVFEAGEWLITRERSGGPKRNDPKPLSICFQAGDDPTKLLAPPPQQKGDPTCVMSKLQIDQKTLSYLTSCKTPMGEMKMSWTGTHTSTEFTATASVKRAWTKMQMKLTGVRTGACKS